MKILIKEHRGWYYAFDEDGEIIGKSRRLDPLIKLLQEEYPPETIIERHYPLGEIHV